MSIPAQGAEGAGQSYQERVRQHFLYVAGDDTTDMPERRDRSCEEFAELQQALGGTLEGWIAVGRYVWGRPIGEPAQEMGGTLNTLAALAAWADLDMMACAEAELERTKRPEIVAKIRRKRANRHGRGVLPGNDADLVTAALASPRSDSDERTAGGVTDEMADAALEHWRKTRMPGVLDGAGAHREWLRGIVSAAMAVQPTPAQPTGAVPDSLRALSELEEKFNASRKHALENAERAKPREDLYDYYCGQLGQASAYFHAVRAVQALLASHPAGQSAGSGAGISVDVQTMRASNGTDYYVRITCDGREVTPHCFKERWKAEYEAAHYAWIFGLRADEPSILAFDPESHPNAPDSTRTGQGEATDGWVLVPAECTVEMIRAARAKAREMLGGALNALAFEDCWDAALAARPAAPEAQGAWSFDMEAAPRDGASLLCVECDEPEKVVDLHWFRDGGTASSWRGSFGQLRRPIAWCRLPAPPASSGQEG